MAGFREECGVFGIWGHPEAVQRAYLGLYALQHRGQESAGLATLHQGKLQLLRGEGHVADVFHEGALQRMAGDAALGHVRYSTAGSSDLANAQPILIGSRRGQIAVAHNGNLVNAASLHAELEADGAIFLTSSDTEVFLHLIARNRDATLDRAILEALQRVNGAYSLCLLTRDALYACRDPRGFRPLSIGLLDGAYVVSSETCVFDLLGAEQVRDVEPGEVLRFNDRGMAPLQSRPDPEPRMCIFEHVYFSRPDSIVFGRWVSRTRRAMGRILAREQPVEADVVVPVPDSGMFSAYGFTEESGIPLRPGILRSHYVGRTFIEPREAVRSFGVRIKLNPVRPILEGQRVVMIDDSIVRGTTSKRIVRMIREAGAREIHVRIPSPPTVSPCYYGVDTPSREELIASSKSVEQIRGFLEADSLGYLSVDGLREAVEDADGHFCTSCYTGDYPIPPDEATPEGRIRARTDQDEAGGPPDGGRRRRE